MLITCAQGNSWGNLWESQRKLRLETSEEHPRWWWHLIWALKTELDFTRRNSGKEDMAHKGDAAGERSGARAWGKWRAVSPLPRVSWAISRAALPVEPFQNLPRTFDT